MLTALLLVGLAAGGLVDNSAFATADGWTVPADSGWAVADDDGHDAPFCLRYRAADQAKAAVVSHELACRPNTEYVVAAWLKGDGTLRPALEVVAPGLDNAEVTRLDGSGAAGEWQRVVGRFNSGGADRLVLRLAADGRSLRDLPIPPGSSAFDDVQLWAAADAPAELEAPGIMRQAPGENVALGRTYQLSPAPGYSYCTEPGDATQLTDGVYSVGYFWVQPTTVGWQRGKPIQIVLDLGQDQPICGVSFNTAGGVAGVGWPTAVLMYVSDDATAWWPAGDLVGLSADNGLPPAEGYGVFRYWTGAMQVHGRYVALLVAPGTNYCFCDEVEVYRGADALLGQARRGEPITDLRESFLERAMNGIIANQVVADLTAMAGQVADSGLPAAQRTALEQELDAAKAEARAERTGVDFKAVLPYNAAQAKAFQVQAALWRAAGRPALQVWQNNRWDPLSPGELPPEGAPAPAVDLAMMRHEQRGAAVNVTNAGPAEATVGVRLDGVPGSPRPPWVKVQEVAWTGTGAGAPVASALPDALPEAGRWVVRCPSGMTRQIWLTVDSTDLDPGTYTGQVVLEAGDAALATVPFTLRVSAVTMPDELSLALGGWDYTDTAIYGVNASNRDAVVAFLQRYHVNLPWATSAAMPFGQHDADGAMTAPPDTSRMDAWLERWPGAAYYAVFVSFSSDLPNTEAARRRVGEWITFWVDHLADQGVKPQQLCLLLVDEPSQKEQDERIVGYAQAIKAAEPEVVIWNDPTWRDPRQATPELLAVSDILCPNRPMWMGNKQVFEQVYLQAQAAGAQLAFYSCSGPVRSLDPYAYHRLQAWDCFRYGMVQEGFWAFGDNGGASAWNELIAPGVCYAPQFIDDDGCTTSKHMEGVREGLYDHEYLAMLRERVEAARKAGRNDEVVQRAAKLLEDGPKEVLDAEGMSVIGWLTAKDRSVADRVARQVLEAIEALGG